MSRTELDLPELEAQATKLVQHMEEYRSAADALIGARGAIDEAKASLDWARGQLAALETTAGEVLDETRDVVSGLAAIDAAVLFTNLESAYEENARQAAKLTGELLRSLDERQATARELVDGLTKRFQAQSAVLLKTFQGAVNSGVVATQVHEAFAPEFAKLQRELAAQRQQVEYLQQKTFTIIKEEISGVRTSVYDATVGGGLSAQVEAVMAPRLKGVDDRLTALLEASMSTDAAVQRSGEAVNASSRLLSDEIVPLRLAVERQGQSMRVLLIASIVVGVIALIAAVI